MKLLSVPFTYSLRGYSQCSSISLLITKHFTLTRHFLLFFHSIPFSLPPTLSLTTAISFSHPAPCSTASSSLRHSYFPFSLFACQQSCSWTTLQMQFSLISSLPPSFYINRDVGWPPIFYLLNYFSPNLFHSFHSTVSLFLLSLFHFLVTSPPSR